MKAGKRVISYRIGKPAQHVSDFRVQRYRTVVGQFIQFFERVY